MDRRTAGTIVEKRSTKGPQPPSEGEVSAAISEDEARDAVAIDAGDFSRPEPENLTVVEYRGLIVEPSNHPHQTVTPEKLDKMSTHEIRAVGHDRGYWDKGVTMLSHPEIKSRFLKHQGEDPRHQVKTEATESA